MVSTVLPLLFDAAWLARHRWLDGTRLGVAGGVLAGWLVLSSLSYVWHRTAHTVPWLWRLTHQVHHSPQRVDIPGSTLFHPTEMVVQAGLQMFAGLVVLGLDPMAVAWLGYVAAFHGMFQHWNVRTPRWLGYFIQRPEAHCEHHRRGVHANNYGDLPWWDMLAGTFVNPQRFDGECGFEAPADRCLGAMLSFVDVNQPLYGERSRGVQSMLQARS